MGEGLGVGLGPENVAGGGQATLEFKVVLDYAVMNQRHSAAAIGVRVGVGVGRRAVGGPAGVPQPQRAARRGAEDRGIQPADLADGLAKVESAGVVHHGDAGAVIAPVFQPLQTFVNDGPGVILADVSNNAAHGNPRLLIRIMNRVYSWATRSSIAPETVFALESLSIGL